MKFLQSKRSLWATLPVMVAWACIGSPTTTTQTLEDQSGTGSLQVVVTTMGDMLDLDGYIVEIDEDLSLAVGINGTVTFDPIIPGTYMVSLTDVAQNCMAQPPNLTSVTVIRDAQIELLFSVTCVIP